MSSVRVAQPSGASPSDRGDDRPREGRRAATPWMAVAGLYGLAVVVYLVLALRTRLPVLFPDEFRYAHLARGLADGHGLDWRGQHVDQTARLYVYALTPLWSVFSSTVDAWRASKAVGTLALCTQVVPVWWLARDVVGPRLALLPAGLTVLGTWMLMSAQTVTEVLAMPLAPAALCVLAMGLRRPGSRLPWAALALLALACGARQQMAALVPAVLVTLLLDVARDPARRTARLHAHRRLLAVFALGAAALVVVAIAAPGVTGEYRGYFAFRPALDRI